MIDKEKIKHLAHLAMLQLENDEIESLTKDINKILAYVEKINELKNLDNFKELVNIIEALPWRADVENEIENAREEIINNFPEKEEDYLKVPKILDK
jgi:aspartyl-tRNA(Asn)/glutamyl-tRNA(Gln) amidotransferase subunit C